MKQHSSKFLALVADAKQHINEITSKTLKEKIDHQEPLCVIDVREESEWASGHIPSALHMSKGIIERDIEKKFPESDTPIVVYCSGGFRCALVADALQKMGYTNVFSLGDGMQGWSDAGYPLVKN